MKNNKQIRSEDVRREIEKEKAEDAEILNEEVSETESEVPENVEETDEGWTMKKILMTAGCVILGALGITGIVAAARSSGYKSGHNDGYDMGLDDGYDKGLEDAEQKYLDEPYYSNDDDDDDDESKEEDDD